jgi:hypothetical protein
MGCLVVLLALLAPRFVMFVLWLFTEYLTTAFASGWWALLGFLFLPTTTIAYAVAQNEFDGIEGWGLVILIVGVAVDLGLVGGSGRGLGKQRS